MGWFGLSRFVVVGDSMLPTYAAGDRLLVRRKTPVAVGDIVVVRDPRNGEPLVKRVVDITIDGRFSVAGDNRERSTDSRHFGPVAPGAVVGRVVRRYA